MFTSCSPTLYKIKEEKQEQIEGKYYKREMLFVSFSTFPFQDYYVSIKYREYPLYKSSYFTLGLKYEGSFESSIGKIKLKIDNDEVITLYGVGYDHNTWYNSWTREVGFFLDNKIVDSIKNCNKFLIQVEDLYGYKLVDIPQEGIAKIKDFINMQQTQ